MNKNSNFIKIRKDRLRIEGWRGAFCECGNTIYMPAPKESGWYCITCPECGSQTILFCEKKSSQERDNPQFKKYF